MIHWQDNSIVRSGSFLDFIENKCIIKVAKTGLATNPKLYFGINEDEDGNILPLMVIDTDLAKELAELFLCFSQTGDL